MNSRRLINLASRPADLPFSDAVLVGDTLYISGRIGIDPATGVAPPEVDQELRFLFEGFSAVLKEAGMTWDDLVWVQIFSPDLTLWERFNVEYVKYFRTEFPARAFLGSAPLLRNGRFEMMGIAVAKKAQSRRTRRKAAESAEDMLIGHQALRGNHLPVA